MSVMPRPKVRPYIWDRGRQGEVIGVAVRSGTAVAFIPDRADQLEQRAAS